LLMGMVISSIPGGIFLPLKNTLKVLLILLIFSVSAASVSAWEIDYAFGSNFAYYVDNNRGGAPGSSWFQLPSYVPKEPNQSDAWNNGIYGQPPYSWGTGDPETRNLGSGWGSDFSYWRFGPAVNIDLNSGHGLTILLQFANGFYISEKTAYARWYQRWEATGETYIKLDRLALAYSWKL